MRLKILRLPLYHHPFFVNRLQVVVYSYQIQLPDHIISMLRLEVLPSPNLPDWELCSSRSPFFVERTQRENISSRQELLDLGVSG